MRKTLLVCCVIGTLLLCSAEQLKPINGRRDSAPRGWETKHLANPEEQITFSILLKQSEQSLARLNEVFEAVSDPRNPQWGQFLTKTELADIMRVSEDVYAAVEAWLQPYQVKAIYYADYVQVITNARTASQLLGGVQFHVFEHTSSEKQLIRYMGQIQVPSSVHGHIDFIAGISEFVVGMNTKYDIRESAVKAGPNDILITPQVLKQYYNVTSGLVGTNKNNLQGIAAFVDYFSYGALEQFQKTEGIASAPTKRFGPDCFPDCDQYESDLDIQYITAMGESINTFFVAQAPDYWILQFAEEVANQLKPTPLVFSISYGWSELAECEIAVANCAKYNYNSQQYVTRTNTALQKLGTLGISVLVSDGDDGAAGLYGASGNCPIDPQHYCPVGGCQFTNSSCPEITIKNITDGSVCLFPMGVGSDACSGFLNDPNVNNVIQDFFSANQNCQVNLDQDYEGNYWIYSACSCSLLQSVNSNGYNVGGYVFSVHNGPVFTADYPTSSPYVTSVGATQFLSNDGRTIQSEVVCSILTGAIITTGGGFSSFQPQLSYQTSTVAAWVNNPNNKAPPSFTYNPSMRAYPDVAFNGHNYLIFYSNDTSDNCPCLSTPVDGTSASSPAFAGLVSLLNDALLNKGKESLGFLNPLLYQAATEAPQVFHDITSGNNNCNRAYCCQYGFSAIPGWDPASGLGSPNFSALLQYVLQKKGAL